MVAETPSAVFHYSESIADEAVTSRKTDAIFRAAKQDLLTLMRLDVSAPACLHHGGQPLDRWRQAGTGGNRWASDSPDAGSHVTHFLQVARAPARAGPPLGGARKCPDAQVPQAAGVVPGTPARMLMRVKVAALRTGSPSHARFNPFSSHLFKVGLPSFQGGLSPVQQSHVRTPAVCPAHTHLLLWGGHCPGFALCVLGVHVLLLPGWSRRHCPCSGASV